MKVYIVLSGRSEVAHKGSWHGCLNYCKDSTEPLRVAVRRAGESDGYIVAEITSNRLRRPENRVSVGADRFADG